MLKSPIVIIKRKSLQERDDAIRHASAELQACISQMFEQYRKHQAEVKHLVELLRGSPCKIGGIDLTFRA